MWLIIRSIVIYNFSFIGFFIIIRCIVSLYIIILFEH